MSTANSLSLDFKNNEDLKAAMADLEPGSRVTLEIEVMVTAVDDEHIEADVEGITVESESEDSTEAETTPDEPVMVVIAQRNKSRSKDAAKEEDAAESDDSDA